MKFVDVVNITVIAGTGGNGCISFIKIGRNKFFRKPNGSNGGDGGNVWLLSDSNIKTLSYFSSHRIFKAGNGVSGRSRGRSGKRGKDMIIHVPVGTRVSCLKTNALLGDMINQKNGTLLLVARGGRHGVGNNGVKFLRNKHYKNNSNILCWDRVQGRSGEIQHLLLDLFLVADVGVFGLPNSGKSSFVSMVSQAKSKVADYPFTTLTPKLGVVQVEDKSVVNNSSFVIEDVPGIIKGASTGSGLGLRFLKHLQRCQMLLHFVDINPADKSDPVKNIIDIEQELKAYDRRLIDKTRWLVFNKIDLLDEFKLEDRINSIIRSVQWNSRYYAISVTHKINISLLCWDIVQFINKDGFIESANSKV
ncbi:GTPase obgE/cgtA [Candidatus Blochmanniella vafra str. BVAF]|uniref:GTPase Obg n=1 Tax=Blochmanniella vafra (strain BVAF) TaxID=859654 RepID=E8Q6R3_BLOVB|nr:Obg family GTPase CgtA [Candidatus Blochmannia vafer]ADV33504.1 GTPase obgE/cgtA [Candidatus Blochmannia vafer str. BVAF]